MDFSEEKIQYWSKKIAGKLFNEYVTKENYSKEKAILVLDNCCGGNFLIEFLNNYESVIISMLIPESERTF